MFDSAVETWGSVLVLVTKSSGSNQRQEAGVDGQAPLPPWMDDREISSRDKWRLLDRLAGYLGKNHRVSRCSKFKVDSNKPVKLLESKVSGKTCFGGLQRCGNVHSCPVDAPKIIAKRQAELKAAEDRSAELGEQRWLVTFTTRHDRNDRLKDFSGRMRQALQILYRMRAYEEWKTAIGLVHHARVTEDTWGMANGWHNHFHLLLFTQDGRSPLCGDLYKKIVYLWGDACVQAGLPRPDDRIGVNIKASWSAAEYLSKLGRERDSWGSDAEMTCGNIKRGKAGRYTYWDLLEMGDREHVVEYVHAKKGQRFIVFSKGFRKHYGLKREKSDEQLANEQTEETCAVMDFEDDEWRTVLKSGFGCRAAIHQAFRIGGLEAVEGYLDILMEFHKFCTQDRARDFYQDEMSP